MVVIVAKMETALVSVYRDILSAAVRLSDIVDKSERLQTSVTWQGSEDQQSFRGKRRRYKKIRYTS